MDTSQSVLFLLLRSALNRDTECTLPDNIDWKAIYNLSYRQSVSSLAIDGFEKTTLDSHKLGPQRNEWYGRVLSEEQNYTRNSQVVQTISERLKEAGIKALLVKGLAHASYYPNPQHRVFGDIDIYAPDSYDRINGILEPVSKNFSTEYYRHSKCSISGINIENHRYLCDVRGQKRWHALEKELNASAREQLEKKTEPGLYTPDGYLTLLFFLYHAQAHLLFESLSLRFLTDWKVMLAGEKETLSSNRFRDSISQYGLEKIATVLTSLCIRHLGTDKSQLPEYLSSLIDLGDRQLEEKVLDNIYEEDKEAFGDSSLKSRLIRAVAIFKKGWKYKEFLHVRPSVFIFKKWQGIVSENIKQIDKRK